MDIEKELARFQRDTANHTMEVKLDNGLYRHLVFTNNGSSCYRFDLITWPGYLCISGDMGCNVFSRVPDMFEFFRSSGRIKPSYWQEKIEDDGRDEVMEFNPDLFRQRILQDVAEVTEGMSQADAYELKEEVQSEILDALDDGEQAAWAAVYRWSDDRLDLTDFGENARSFCEFTVHYIWRCHAIVWGIHQYDQYKINQEAAREAA